MLPQSQPSGYFVDVVKQGMTNFLTIVISLLGPSVTIRGTARWASWYEFITKNCSQNKHFGRRNRRHERIVVHFLFQSVSFMRPFPRWHWVSNTTRPWYAKMAINQNFRELMKRSFVSIVSGMSRSIRSSMDGQPYFAPYLKRITAFLCVVYSSNMSPLRLWIHFSGWTKRLNPALLLCRATYQTRNPRRPKTGRENRKCGDKSTRYFLSKNRW